VKIDLLDGNSLRDKIEEENSKGIAIEIMMIIEENDDLQEMKM